jgi:hypothetical protein
MKTVATNRKLRELLVGIRTGTLVPRPEFQRRLVWANKHKVALLQTVMAQYPFPEIYIAAGDVNAETGEGTEMLVDGQQRITTLYQYFSASTELRLAGDLSPYADLTPEEKLAFLEYDVVIRNLGKLSTPEIKEVFQRINSTNYALNAMEIHNARFEGAFKSFAERMTLHPFFDEHRIFTASDIRRMGDLRYLMTVIITMLSTYFNRDDELESYLKTYNDEFERDGEIQERLNAACSFIERCAFSPKMRVWKKSDLFTLLVEVDRALHRNAPEPSVEVVSYNLSSFYDLIDELNDLEEPRSELVQYYKASLQATNDRSSRIRRGEIIAGILSVRDRIDWDLWIEQDESALVDEMIDWFFEKYEDPVHGVPYDSSEGGYQYSHGGPYRAEDILAENFPTAPDPALKEAIKRIHSSGMEWVRKGVY